MAVYLATKLVAGKYPLSPFHKSNHNDVRFLQMKAGMEPYCEIVLSRL